MSCNCNKPKCDGKCGISPSVLQINNPGDCTLFHRVEVPASMGDSTTNPPKNGDYRNVLLYYVADGTSWFFSSDGIPQKLVSGFTDYEDAINLPSINGVTLLRNKTGEELGLQDKLTAGDNIQISDQNVISATDTTYGPATDDEIGLVKPGDGLEVSADGVISISDIEQYAHFFDTVADMKSAENLTDGSYARTLGYYSVNDGGGALYKIVDTIDNSNYQENLGDGLYATLIIDGVANVKQYGVNSSQSDNTTALNNAISYNTVLEGVNEVIEVKGKIEIEHHELNYDFKGMTIKYTGVGTDKLITIESDSTNIADRVRGCIKNLIVDSNALVEEGLAIYDSQRLMIEKCRFRGATVAEIKTYNVGGKLSSCNVALRDIRCDCRQYYEPACENCVALDLGDCHDCFVNNFIGHEYTVSIKNAGLNWFDMVHCWNWYCVAGSVMFEINGTGGKFSNIYCDTIETVASIKGGCHVEMEMLQILFNDQAPDIINANPLPFKVDNAFCTNYGKLKITNGYLQSDSSKHDLIEIPNGTTMPQRLNFVSIVNSYLPSYNVNPQWLEYYHTKYAITDFDLAAVMTNNPSFTRAWCNTIKGEFEYNFEVVTNLTGVNLNTWTTILTPKSATYFPFIQNNVMSGLVRDADNGNFYNCQWRVDGSGNIQIRLGGDFPITGQMTLLLKGSVSREYINPSD